MLNRRFCKVVSCLLILSVVLGLGVIPSKVSAAGTTAVTGLKISVGSKDVTKTTYSMAVGKKKTLTVSAKPKAAAQVATFESSDTSIVTVSSAGKVSALRPGTAKITVTISSSKYKKTTTWVKIKVKTPDYYKVSESGNEMYDGERKQDSYDSLCATYAGVEFWSVEVVKVTFPAEGVLVRKILVKNTTDHEVGFNVGDTMEEDYSGSFNEYAKQKTMIVHPNGTVYYPLAPGEETIVEANLSFGNALNDGKTHDIKGDLNFKVNFRVFKDGISRPDEVKVELKNNISYISNDLLKSKKYKTATVKGTVLDPFGKPVKGAKVTLVNRFADEKQEVTTGKDGTYEFKTSAHKTAYSGMWREEALYISAPGYIDKGVIVYPKTGKTVTIKPTLFYKEYEYTYEQTKKVDIGIQGYEYDTDNESVAVFAPFHTGLPYEQIADRLKLTATDFDGNVAFTYSLPSEIPYVDVSADGKYVVALENQKDNSSYKITLLDKTGKKVYSTDETQLPSVDKYLARNDTQAGISRCASLSDDNRYLIASHGEGYVWCIDWQANKVIWTDYLCGQIRNIKFSPDGSDVYISSGNGYLYAFGMDGTLKWKTFVSSWATKMLVTDKYVICATKNAGDNIFNIERNTGRSVWSFPQQQSAAMGLSVTPDEKYLWIGFFAATSYDVNESSVYDLATGKIVATFDKVIAMGGEYTKDGKLLITKDRNSFSVYGAKSGELLFTKRIAAEDDLAGNFAITANTDGSKIIVTMNTDTKHEYYGMTYYFKLTKKTKVK